MTYSRTTLTNTPYRMLLADYEIAGNAEPSDVLSPSSSNDLRRPSTRSDTDQLPHHAQSIAERV
jgi:hypothetical protein